MKSKIVLFMLLVGTLFMSVNADSLEYANDWVYEGDSSANCVVISSDGSYIAVGTSDGLYLLSGQGNLLWDYQTDYPIIDVSMTADANKIVAAGSRGYFGGGVAYFFNRVGEFLSSTEVSTGIPSVSYSPEGNYFGIVYTHGLGWNDVVALWGYDEQKWLWNDTFGRHETAAVSVSADGEYTAVGGAAMLGDGGLRFYDKSGGFLWEYSIDTAILSGDKYSVAISLDGEYIVAGNEDNDNLYFFNNQGFLWSYETGPVQGVSISADGNYLVAASSDKVFLFNCHKDSLRTIEIDNIKDVAISADGEIIVASTADGKVYTTPALTPFDAYPVVNNFDVSPHSLYIGDLFTISYTISDDIGLKQVELWRTNDINGEPDLEWPDNPKQTTLLSNQTTYSGSFTDDTLDVPGTYWYGLHVVDNSGDPEHWNDEQNSRTGGSPGDYGPLKVTVSVLDTIPPVITLIGEEVVNLYLGDSYTDAGATALDDVDGDITAKIVVVNPVDTSRVGTYVITYNVSDTAGNAAEEVIRTVIVSALFVANAGPDRVVFSGDTVSFDASSSYDPEGTELIYEWDFEDGEIAAGCQVTHRFRGAMNELKVYHVALTVQDAQEITATDTAQITVKPLEKPIEVFPSLPQPMPSNSFAKAVAYYNWVGVTENTQEDVYIISRISLEAQGFVSYLLSIWDNYSLSIGVPVWSKAVVAFWQPVEKIFVYPFGTWRDWNRSFDDGYFEGMAIGASDKMRLWAFNVEIIAGLAVPSWNGASAFFAPSSEAELIIDETPPDLIFVHLCSPGELRVYDSQDRVTGLINEVVKEEIPGSIYDEQSKVVAIFPPFNTYRYDVVGTDEGIYELDISFVENDKLAAFTAADISTSPNAVHQYTMDWEALSQGEEGATLQIDADGDSVFEKTIVSDNELIGEELTVAVEEQEKESNIPKAFALFQNYPNPFNPTTKIAFSLPKNSYVTLTVFNIPGQKVATLVDELRQAGNHQVIFNGANFPSGIYFYCLKTEGFSKTMKMLLIK